MEEKKSKRMKDAIYSFFAGTLFMMTFGIMTTVLALVITLMGQAALPDAWLHLFQEI